MGIENIKLFCCWRKFITVVLIMFGSWSMKGQQIRPNVIYILADDLGYGELGCYGQKKISTPNIDLLAKNGMLFTQHYSGSTVCAPSRCALLTGKHTGHTDIRDNGRLRSVSEGQRPLKETTFTLGDLFKKAGYVTACIGKWGLGYPGSTGDPNHAGFDYFFGFNCQTHAHGYYPQYLWKNQHKAIIQNPKIPLKATFPRYKNINNPNNYNAYKGENYATDLMLSEALAFIKNHDKQPFFLYYASPIPHAALQVPEKDIQHYKEKFPDHPYLGNNGYVPQQYPRAAYAAMISKLDHEVGAIIDQLKKRNSYKNTLIIFSSDNGSSASGGADPEYFNSTGKLRDRKSSLYEGGIRVPMLVCWPGHVKAGSRSDHISAFWDVMPTLADILNIRLTGTWDGISFLPELSGSKKQKKHQFLYWEYRRKQAVRMGKWKALRSWRKGKPRAVELYDLENDIGETTDLARQYPLVVEAIKKIMDQRIPSDYPQWNFGIKRK